MATVVQYVIERKKGISPVSIEEMLTNDLDYQLSLQEYETSNRLAEEIGLETSQRRYLARKIQFQSGPRIEVAKRCGYEELPVEKVYAWRKWMKCTQLRNRNLRLRRYLSNMYDFKWYSYEDIEPWESYASDSIPIRVQEVISTELKNPLWDRLVISAFANACEPILYGTILTQPELSVEAGMNFLLARWGESDAALVSWEEIMQYAPSKTPQRKKFLGLF